MHGVGPYSIATDIMYASLIPIIVFTEGKARKKGTEPTAKRTRIIQVICGGLYSKSQIAHEKIGNAAPVTRIIRVFTLSGSCIHVMAAYSEHSFSRPLSSAGSRRISSQSRGQDEVKK